MLERQAADSLAPGHLRTLLAFLCDQALDAGAMRDALAARQESADEARANMRKATMEEKRKINVRWRSVCQQVHVGTAERDCVGMQPAVCMWCFAADLHMPCVHHVFASLLDLQSCAKLEPVANAGGGTHSCACLG